MKCPLREQGKLGTGNDFSNGYCDCLEGGCAFFDKDKKQCAVLTIAKALDKTGVNVRVAK